MFQEQRHREKAEEGALSQADPSGLRTPREAAGTLSCWKADPWKDCKQGVDGGRQMCFKSFSMALLEN